MTTRGAGGGTARLLKERQLDRRKQDGQLPLSPLAGDSRPGDPPPSGAMSQARPGAWWRQARAD